MWWFDNVFEASYDAATDAYITIKLNGHVRTTVESLAFAPDSKYTLEFNREYKICGRPTEYEGGNFHLRVNETSRECQALPNPLIHFDSSGMSLRTVCTLLR